MTPLPKRRWSTRRQGKRRNAIKLAVSSFVKCKSCQALRKSHTACPSCGVYKTN